MFHAVDESIIALKPTNLSYLEAARLPLAAGTAWEMLVTRAQLRIGESILIHGGAGRVGSITIQLVKAMGATVFTTAKGIHIQRLGELGADYVIDYQNENHLSRVNQLTQGRGVDVIVDSIGGMALSESPMVLAQLGRVVTLVDIATPQNLIHAWGKMLRIISYSPARTAASWIVSPTWWSRAWLSPLLILASRWQKLLRLTND